MRSKSNLVLTMVFILYFGLPRADAIMYIDDGGTHDVNYPINDEVWIDWQAPGVQTTLNLLEGGSINQPYDLQAYENSQIDIFGGSIGNAFYAYDSSQVNIYSGSISWRIIAYDSSQVSFGGGVIGGYMDARDNSRVDIFGGWMQSLHVYINSNTILSGGYIKNLLVVYTTGTLTIKGCDFEVDGVPCGYGELSSILGGSPWNEPHRHLTGTLATGEPIDNDFYIGEEGRIVLVHEPSTIDIDIKPGSCPSTLNVKSLGVLPVAIFGSEDFDVNSIDIASIRLVGIAAIRSSFEDVGTPLVDANKCECSTEGPDGFLDLTLKFETQRIVEAIGEVDHGDELVLELTGVLSDETPIEGSDCVIIHGRHKPLNRADFNGDGTVDMADFAAFTKNWLQ